MQDFSSQNANLIFDDVILNYHIFDSVDQDISNPYEDRLHALLYHKCWIDTVQWHVEDLVRDPEIDPQKGIEYKRLIDRLNQQRTDTVEKLDDYFLETFKNVTAAQTAKLNTESPAWAIDRLSILALKIFHMQIEVSRLDIDSAKKALCKQKLDILLEQRVDLSNSIDELLADIATGRKKMKVYRQLKMYNDPHLNPVLYNKK
jgi:Protein of unknown function (DUF4254)